MKETDQIPLSQALYSVIHGSGLGVDHCRFPQIDMMIVLDILSTISRCGKMTYKQISSLLNGKPNRDTVRKYLNILVELHLISITSQQYHGIARTKKSFEITEKGKEFVTSTSKILSR
ncbi:MAG: hypothetical protein JRN67_08550 [Nitrososphaerota archaeon]|nr:hypothetical protein [Nitrososphaerota archaeon]